MIDHRWSGGGGALGLLGTLAAVTIGGAAQSDQLTRWEPMVAEASQRFAIPVAWITRVMGAESRGRTALAGVPIRSRAGAIGLMQLMPATWADMRRAYDLGADPDDPHDNITAGTAYLRLMYDRFGYPGLFAAYNAGPRRYAASLATGERLPDETLAYLATATGQPETKPAAKTLAAMQGMFVVRHDQQAAPKLQADNPAAPSLFAVGGVAP